MHKGLEVGFSGGVSYGADDEGGRGRRERGCTEIDESPGVGDFELQERIRDFAC